MYGINQKRSREIMSLSTSDLVQWKDRERESEIEKTLSNTLETICS